MTIIIFFTCLSVSSESIRNHDNESSSYRFNTSLLTAGWIPKKIKIPFKNIR